jgi:hypothetical protein
MKGIKRGKKKNGHTFLRVRVCIACIDSLEVRREAAEGDKEGNDRRQIQHTHNGRQRLVFLVVRLVFHLQIQEMAESID